MTRTVTRSTGQPEVHPGTVLHDASCREPDRKRARRSVAAVLAAGALVAGACSDGSEERGLEALDTPAFAPDSTTTAPAAVGEQAPAQTSSTVPVAAASADAGPATTAPSTVAGTTPSAAGGGPSRQVVSFDDPVGDAVGGLDDDPPAWADIAGARLVRNDDAYGLSVRLGGGTVPQRAPDGRTLNVATFFDVDGDGVVDFEIWANLGTEGWGVAYYDNTDGTGGFGDESNVTVMVRDQSLELVFPDVLLDQAERFRFSLASEYGNLDVLGSAYAHRDDAPDGGRAVAFPA